VGKYSGLKGKLPAFEEEPSWQEKINEEKNRILGGAENVEHANTAALARKYDETRQEKDFIKQQLKAINLTEAALEQLLLDRMQTDGQKSITLVNGTAIHIKDEIMPSVQDRALMLAWVKETDQEAILTINPMTLKGLVGHLLDEGLDAPPGIKVFFKQGLLYYGSK
jgi:hypothetical protein